MISPGCSFTFKVCASHIFAPMVVILPTEYKYMSSNLLSFCYQYSPGTKRYATGDSPRYRAAQGGEAQKELPHESWHSGNGKCSHNTD